MSEKSPFNRSHSRRRFLQVAGAAGFTVASSGLGDYAVAQTPVAPANLSQAPFLDGQQLPPVAERVGQQPLVVQPNESVGQYGGTMVSGLIGRGENTSILRMCGYDYLVAWSVDWSEVLPNIAHSFEASDDARSFTFHLRPGMKWSDGAPFTSADVEFYVNNVYRNEELTSSLGTNPFTIEVQDDVTFMITYEQPNGFALQDMCSADGADWTRYPRHYLEQFHAEFNTKDLDQLVEQEGAADWAELFQIKGGGVPGTSYDARWSNPELPTLLPWRLVTPYGEGTRVRLERNPYYWKVDPDGRQLPYIDDIVFDVVEENEVLLLRALNGEIDFHIGDFTTTVNKPVLAENRESGNFEFFDLVDVSMNENAIAVNLTHKDPALREIFQNKDFRVGLSHAINRQEVIDVVFVSQGEPWQLAPRDTTPWYNEELAKQFTEYDVDLANEHLDRVLPDKDGEGMRLMANGEPFIFTVDVDVTDVAEVDSANLVVEHWRAVGVNASLNPIDNSLLFNRKAANEHDCVWDTGSGGSRDAILDPRWYFPSSTASNFGIAWWIWNEDPADAQAEPMEPPADVKRQMELYNQIERTADSAVQNELFTELLAITQEQYYAIGVNLPPRGYAVKKVNLRNVPNPMLDGWLYPNPGPTRLEQYYYEGGQPSN